MVRQAGFVGARRLEVGYGLAGTVGYGDTGRGGVRLGRRGA